MNPFAGGALDNLKKYIFDPQHRQTMGSANQTAGGVGAERSALTSQNLDKTQGDTLTGALAGYYNSAAQQGFQARQNQAAAGYGIGAMGSQDLQSQLAAFGAQQGSGNNQWSFEQAPNQAQYQQGLMAFQTPMQLAQMYASLAPGYGGTQSGSQTTTYPQQSIFGQIAGLAGAGLGAYRTFGNPFGGDTAQTQPSQSQGNWWQQAGQGQGPWAATATGGRVEGYASGGMPGQSWSPFAFADDKLSDAPKSTVQQITSGLSHKADGGSVNPYNMGEGFAEGGMTDDVLGTVRSWLDKLQPKSQVIQDRPAETATMGHLDDYNSPFSGDIAAASLNRPSRAPTFPPSPARPPYDAGPSIDRAAASLHGNRAPEILPPDLGLPLSGKGADTPEGSVAYPNIGGLPGVNDSYDLPPEGQGKIPDWLRGSVGGGPFAPREQNVSTYDPADKPTGSPVGGGGGSDAAIPGGDAAAPPASPYPSTARGEPPLPGLPQIGNDRSSQIARNPWLALMQAGLAAAASGGRDAHGLPLGGSPFGQLARAIGVGGQEGIKTLQQQRDEARKDEMAKFQTAMQRVPYTNMTAAQKAPYENLTAAQRLEAGKPVVIGYDALKNPILGVRDPRNPGRYLDPTTGKPITGAASNAASSGSAGPDGTDEQGRPFYKIHGETLTPGVNIPAGVNPEVLRALDKKTAALIRNLDEGRGNLGSLGFKERTAAASILNEYDPAWNQGVYQARQKQLSDLTSNGNAGKMMMGVDQLLPHIQTAIKDAIALDNSDYPAGNWLVNKGREFIGDERIKKFQHVREVLSADAARILKGSGAMAQPDIDAWRKTISENDSPRALIGTLHQLADDLMEARVGSLQSRHQSIMRTDPANDPYFPRLSKQAEGALTYIRAQKEKYSPDREAPASPPAQTHDDVLSEAKSAISKGATRDAVIKRLQAQGIDPVGL